jgi:hypothetical protein
MPDGKTMARLTDDIIEEIHAVRQEHAARFAHDIGRIVDDLQAGQEKHVAEGWKLIKAPTAPPAHPDFSIAAIPIRPTAALKV